MFHKLKYSNHPEITFEDYPEECPCCHSSILPLVKGNWNDTENNNYNKSFLFLQCPRPNCRICFSVQYTTTDNRKPEHYNFKFEKIVKENIYPFYYSEIINNVSNSFVVIYNQAYTAEQLNLSEIAGVGYRKALEFLIKDYLIQIKPDSKDSIEKSLLMSCIAQFVDNNQIKSVAQRAVWLGNDETHYIKKWTTKTIDDLKILIQLTVRWIEMEKLTIHYEDEMPR